MVIEGTVLVHNDGPSPARRGAACIGSLAVIGPNAGAFEAGGGSSEVTPHVRRRLVDAVAERVPGASVAYEVGCRIDRVLPTIDVGMLTPPSATAPTPGSTLTYFDNADLAGGPVATEKAHLGRLTWVGPPHPDLHLLGGALSGSRRRSPPTSTVRGSSGSRARASRCCGSTGRRSSTTAHPQARPWLLRRRQHACSSRSTPWSPGGPHELVVELWPRVGVVTGTRRPGGGRTAPSRRTSSSGAMAVPRRAPMLPLVVVGSNRSWESEGFDRPDLSLPGDQRRRVEAVIAANPSTIVVVNAGSPVEMPWAATAGAVLVAWYPGEEGADALADMLMGLDEPSGRLPITFPNRIEDTPTYDYYPGRDGKVTYGEGVFVGYRHYESAEVVPLFPVRARPVPIRRSTTACPRLSRARVGWWSAWSSPTPGPGAAARWCRCGVRPTGAQGGPARQRAGRLRQGVARHGLREIHYLTSDLTKGPSPIGTSVIISWAADPGRPTSS